MQRVEDHRRDGRRAVSAISQPNGDCGKDFANWYLGYVHPDTHAMAFDPGNSDTLYVGSDGGLARTPDGGATVGRLNGESAPSSSMRSARIPA
ncbi:MAG: hypothetical protein U0441_18945 [Polyangiaceae bacterium]